MSISIDLVQEKNVAKHVVSVQPNSAEQVSCKSRPLISYLLALLNGGSGLIISFL